MSVRPDVSVCIVNWNGKAVLGNCLQSLRHGPESVGVEIIVVDNASTDGSLDGLGGKVGTQEERQPDGETEEHCKPIVLICNSENAGFSAANNQAAARATGRYLLFLNNDTVVPAGAIEQLVRYLDEHPNVVAVGPQLTGGDGMPQRTGRNLPTLRAMLHRNVLPVRWTHLFARQYRDYRHTHDPQKSGAVPQLAAAALMVRPEPYTAMGGWDQAFQFGVEDVDFCQRLAKFGPIHYLADARIIHLGRVSSHLNRPWVFRSYQFGYVKYFRKHHRSRWAPLIYKAGITADTPIRLLSTALKGMAAKAFGNCDEANKTLQKAQALWEFLSRQMIPFWRA